MSAQADDVVQVEVLQVNDGDVLMLRFEPTEITTDAAKDRAFQLREMYRRQGKETTVLVAPLRSIELERFDEAAMRQLGWVRPARNAEKLLEAKEIIRELLDPEPYDPRRPENEGIDAEQMAARQRELEDRGRRFVESAIE